MTNGTPKKHVDGVTQRTAPHGRSKEIEMGGMHVLFHQKHVFNFPELSKCNFNSDACMHVHGPMIFVPARETVFGCARARCFDLFHFERANHCDACMHEKFLAILRVKFVHACMH